MPSPHSSQAQTSFSMCHPAPTPTQQSGFECGLDLWHRRFLMLVFLKHNSFNFDSSHMSDARRMLVLNKSTKLTRRAGSNRY